jgi:hypothetical protein
MRLIGNSVTSAQLAGCDLACSAGRCCADADLINPNVSMWYTAEFNKKVEQIHMNIEEPPFTAILCVDIC